MKCVKVTISGLELHLLFNGAAMFEIEEQFGSASELLNIIKEDTKEAFAALCDAVFILAEQGELARRYAGYEAGEIPTKEKLGRVAMPNDILDFKIAVPQAITLGYGREIEPENGEVDLVLAELNQKKTR
jgi:hypothetical protein